jgi:hypothetical protein
VRMTVRCHARRAADTAGFNRERRCFRHRHLQVVLQREGFRRTTNGVRPYPGDLLIVRAGTGRKRAIGTRALCSCRVAQHRSVAFAAGQLIDRSSHA